MVDVVANDAAGYERSNDVTVAALSEGTAQAIGATCREQARYEREVAALDLTDAAQAMTRSQPKGYVDAPVDSSQVDLATALYASADRRRRLAEGLESGSVAPVVPDELR